ncbi:MAG: rhomboid family intramembrane serine protease GlpG [Paraglaciecola sp.]|uniref:rhomboid family intramembrane serine protease GlpG n=1 Tax=Paraglaciecola sp. TaxID=1920173 RepID=UPI00273E0151|nr:rhomboid family intramembrane serine protease GlpG [Paraglaciecola sp.]MDP5029058.1 rhomboid family intramembrane serine protease GlpG [Paraglaciecola sp.]MDP5129621.1 rhomboid family intramembrane serine protease GlpG [Paraglaciecola sp.]
MSDLNLLVTFSKERPARLLTDYLQNQGVEAQYILAHEPNGHSVVVHQSQWQIAKSIADEFVADPYATKYQEAAWQQGNSINLPASSWFSSQLIVQNLKQVPLTSIILVVCLLTFGLAFLGILGPYNWLRILPLSDLADNHQWWRIVGPAFIHFSTLHIAFNILWWWMLGKQIEQTFGKSCLLLLFLFTAITSNIAQLLIDGPNFGGLSGVVYGLVGCVWWLGWLKPQWGISLPKPIIIFLLVWLVVGYADILWLHMANTAHTAGLISGCLFAFVLSRFECKQVTPDRDIL